MSTKKAFFISLLTFFSLTAIAIIALALTVAAHEQPKHATELTSGTFNSVVKDPSKHVFVVFYAPWCGHCSRMMPKWEELAAEMANVSSVVIARVDATKYTDIAQEYGVHGFPTMRLFPKGNKNEGVVYRGAREVDDWKRFLQAST